MGLYFFVFYVVAAVGLDGFGWLSDMLARRAAAGGTSVTDARALGLHGAMYVIPVLTALLVPVLLAGSRTVRRDQQRAQLEQAAAKGEPGA
jgi:hypothetical protein